MNIFPGSIVTTKFDNKFVHLWHSCPDFTEINHIDEKGALHNMGPIWHRGSWATVLEVSEPWVRVMTPAGPGWILRHNLEIT